MSIATFRAIQMVIAGIVLLGWTIAEPGPQILVGGVGGYLAGAGLTALYLDLREAKR